MVLKKRLRECGWDPTPYSFHSIHGGTLASSVLASSGDQEKLTGILELSAIVCGWTPYSRSELGYIKDVQARTLVASRVIGLRYPGNPVPTLPHSERPLPSAPAAGVAPPLSRLLVDPPDIANGYCLDVMDTEQFHGITLREPQFSADEYVKETKKIFETGFIVPFTPNDNYKRRAELAWNRVLAYWGRTLSDKTVPPGKHRAIGRQHLIDKVYNKKELPIDVAGEMYGIALRHPGVKESEEPKEKKPTSLPTPPVNPRPKALGRTGKVQRKRIKWEGWEDAIIIKAWTNRKPFKKILKEVPDRTDTDCQLRIGVLQRKGIVPKEPPPLVLPKPLH